MHSYGVCFLKEPCLAENSKQFTDIEMRALFPITMHHEDFLFQVKGFQLEYLVKVPEVKDTVHKHSLLHHLCHMVMEKFPDSTDLYSEVRTS